MNRAYKETLLSLKHANNYEEWREAALDLDSRNGAEAWREDDASDDFDWRLIRSRLRQIRQCRAENQHLRLIHNLRQGLHWNLGNTGNPSLYSYTLVGTKKLVDDYLKEVCDALVFIADLDIVEFPYADKIKFFQDVALAYGRSALMLSGGATLGMFHVGVVKALFKQGLLPKVLSGSSAGSIVASVVGARTESEAAQMMDPESAYYHFWRLLPFRQMLQHGAIMDQSQLRRAIAANIPDITFEDAQKLSGRTVNITVSPAGINQAPKLLNYLTFPYLYLHEAVLASCAVPVIFPPVMLMTRSEENERMPYMPLLRWNDGSLKSDLPMTRLRRLHNVNHFIVSQTNPHVLPFVSKNVIHSSNLGDSSKQAVYSALRGTANAVLKFARSTIPIDQVKMPLDTAVGMLDQDYRGNINIVPEVSLWRYANVTSNPTIDSIARFTLEGERATWPRMEMIRNQTMVSQTLDNCITKLEALQLGRRSNDPITDRKPKLRIVQSQS